MSTIVVFAGGPTPDDSIAEYLPAADVVVAADSGLEHARALGLVPAVVVGDMDSVSAGGLSWAVGQGAEVVEHPPDKDATDLDLALTMAARSADRIVVVDSGEGRLDHSIANLLLLGSERFAGVDIFGFMGNGLVTVVRRVSLLSGCEGEQVSLLAVGGDALGVSTEGLRWELDEAVLEPASTWGVSNEFASGQATVSVASGVLLAVQPVRHRLPD